MSFLLKAAGLVVLLASAAFTAPQPEGSVVRLSISEGSDLRFRHLPMGTDPSHRRITGFAQDDFGFLWLGTDDGLMRYDGYRMRTFRHNPGNPNSPGDTYVIALFKDRSGKLWVPTAARLLDVYDPATETFTPFRIDGRSGERLLARVGEINQDAAGTIWLATDQGLFQVDEKTWKSVHYTSKPDDPGTLSSNVVRATLETKDGTFWVATTRGLDVLDRRTGKVTRRIAFLMEHSVWTKLIEDQDGVLWMSYSRAGYPGLASVDRVAGTLRHYQLIPPDEKVTPGLASMVEDPEGNLWLGGTSAGLFRLDRERKHVLRYRNQATDPHSLAGNQVQRLFADREGNMWVGTAGDGADRFVRAPLPFRRYVHEPDNPRSIDKELVWSVYEDSRGTLWIGSVKSLLKVDRRSGHFEFFRVNAASWAGQLSGVWVRTMVEDRSGNMWFGTSSGLNRLDVKTGRVRVFRHDRNDPHSLSNDQVRSLLVDRKGVLWVGTEDGLNAFDASTESFRVYPAPAAPSQYWTMVEGTNGELWLSSRWCGAHRFDPATGKFTVYRHSQTSGSLSSDVTTALRVDHSGTVWVGTQVGLERLDPVTGGSTVYRPTEGAEPIFSVLEDSAGNLWLGTLNGLLRFDPRNTTFRRYHASDGLAANELAWGAAWKSPRGEMFFGSQGGLTMFFPEQIRDKSYVPPVVLTDMQILGKPVGVGGDSPLQRSIAGTHSLVLKYAQNSTAFEFSALSYADPERNRYRYRLEPREPEWQEADSSRRTVTYMSIPAGHYVFRVQGSNSRGVWNDQGGALELQILPPWWGTWQFRSVSVLACIALIWVAWQYRVRQLHRNLRSLQDVVDTIPTMAWTAPPDGSHAFVNRRWVEFTGLTADHDKTGLHWTSAVHPEDLSPALEKWRKALAAGEPFEWEARFRSGTTGEYRWLLSRGVPVRDQSGKVIRWYGVLTDIEDRKRAERERERALQLEADLAHINRVSMMGELAASIVHEVNQPLSGIVSNGGACIRWLAQDPPKVEEAREAAYDIVRDGKRAGDVIARLRSLTKRSPVSMEKLDLNQTIREVVILIADQSSRHNVAVRTNFANDALPVAGDRVQLQQVVLNLVINAIDAMSVVSDRARVLVISTRNVDEFVEASFDDSGVGIAPENMHRIFDSFYTTKSAGMGMGLSICRSILEAHGGRLWAVSKSDGTVFRFVLRAWEERQRSASSSIG